MLSAWPTGVSCHNATLYHDASRKRVMPLEIPSNVQYCRQHHCSRANMRELPQRQGLCAFSPPDPDRVIILTSVPIGKAATTCPGHRSDPPGAGFHLHSGAAHILPTRARQGDNPYFRALSRLSGGDNPHYLTTCSHSLRTQSVTQQ